MRLAFTISLMFLSFIFTEVEAHIDLTEGNRLIPISILYEVPTKAQIARYNEIYPSYLSQHQGTPPYRLLILKNNTDHERTWVLTSVFTSAIKQSPALIRYKNSSFTKLDNKIIQWPTHIEMQEITIPAFEQVEIIFSTSNIPTQLWSGEWLTNKLGQYSQYSSLMWGAILSLLLLHFCNCILVGSSNLNTVLLQLTLSAALANELGLIEIVKPEVSGSASTTFLLSISLLLMVKMVKLQNRKISIMSKNQLLTLLYTASILGVIASVVLTQVSLDSISSTLPLYLLCCFSILLSTSIYDLFKQGNLDYLCNFGSILFVTLFCTLIQNNTAISDKLLLYLPIFGVSILSFTAIQARITKSSIGSFELDLEYSSRLNKMSLQHKFDELEISHRLLQEKNAIDFLTGLKNRQFFDERYHSELARSAREGTPVSLILIDLDHFKSVNDSYGHQVGDEVLKMVAKRFYYALNRPADAICRYGGEEFVILLPNTHIQGAKHIAEQIGVAVNSKPIMTVKGDINISISQGVASLIHHTNMDELKLLNLADQALYRAKALGRNRFEVAPTKPYIVKEQA